MSVQITVIKDEGSDDYRDHGVWWHSTHIDDSGSLVVTLHNPDWIANDKRIIKIYAAGVWKELEIDYI